QFGLFAVGFDGGHRRAPAETFQRVGLALSAAVPTRPTRTPDSRTHCKVPSSSWAATRGRGLRAPGTTVDDGWASLSTWSMFLSPRLVVFSLALARPTWLRPHPCQELLGGHGVEHFVLL